MSDAHIFFFFVVPPAVIIMLVLIYLSMAVKDDVGTQVTPQMEDTFEEMRNNDE